MCVGNVARALKQIIAKARCVLTYHGYHITSDSGTFELALILPTSANFYGKSTENSLKLDDLTPTIKNMRGKAAS